jgi:hypothetical protein
MIINNELLKRISIRGRVAFALFLLEQIIAKNDLFYLKMMIKYIKEFTESRQLDEWHYKIEKLTPEYILNSEYYELKNIINELDFKNLKQCYYNLPEDVLMLVEDTIWIGISNLYGDTGEYSKGSLFYLRRVLLHSEKYNLEYPVFHNRFSFFEGDGWGAPFNYDIEKKTFIEKNR